jgi:hypothetical protein
MRFAAAVLALVLLAAPANVYGGSRRMKIAGIALTSIGVGLIVLSIVPFALSAGCGRTDDACGPITFGSGLGLAVFGVGAVASGVPLWVIGARGAPTADAGLNLALRFELAPRLGGAK